MKLFGNLVALGERKAGTSSGRLACEVLADTLRNAHPSLKVKEEPFRIIADVSNHATIRFGHRTIRAYLFENTASDASPVSAEMFEAGAHLMPWEAAKARGKIVVFRPHLLTHRIAQILSARKNGAVGVIIISPHQHHVQRGLGCPPFNGPSPIPAVGITLADWQILRGSGARTVTIVPTPQRHTADACNVVVDVPGSASSDRQIVIGAHYDSWHAGAQDNAIAVQVVFDALRAITGQRKLRHPVRAVFFDAEELGMVGSFNHIRANDHRSYGCFINVEMPVPTRWGGVKTLFYSKASTTNPGFANLALLGRGTIPFPFELFYRLAPVFPSDSHYFHEQGIPCASTYCSSPLLHTPLDTSENLSMRDYPNALELILTLLERADRRLDETGL